MESKKEKISKIKVAIISLPENSSRLPLIGPNIIARYVRDNLENSEVKLIDNTFENVIEKIENFKPDIVGISTFTSYYQDTIDFAKKIKEKNPGVKIVVGGPHITTLPESFDKVFDFGVMGEGERTMVELLKALRENKILKNIKGLIYYDKGKLRINKPRELSKDLDDVFKMDYNFYNEGYFKKRFIPEDFGFGVSMAMMTSIGCPFNCRFCSIKICWNRLRFRKIECVINEIKDLYYNHGVRHIDFVDDLFSVNKPRLRNLIEALREENLLGKISFGCQARANTFDEEMCQIFKELNLNNITFGFESGSDRMLKYIKNDSTLSVESNKNAILLCKKYGLNASGGLIIGMPGEKLEDMQKTIDFIDFGRKNGVARLWTQILVPFPGTEIWEIAKQRGKITDNFYKKRIDVYNKKTPLLLDDDVPYKEFIKKYNLAKKKCQYFVYRIFLKTIINNPFAIFYFIGELGYYFKRYVGFIKQ